MCHAQAQFRNDTVLRRRKLYCSKISKWVWFCKSYEVCCFGIKTNIIGYDSDASEQHGERVDLRVCKYRVIAGNTAARVCALYLIARRRKRGVV